MPFKLMLCNYTVHLKERRGLIKGQSVRLTTKSFLENSEEKADVHIKGLVAFASVRHASLLVSVEDFVSSFSMGEKIPNAHLKRNLNSIVKACGWVKLSLTFKAHSNNSKINFTSVCSPNNVKLFK